jgi:LysR family glycine cleavage system transcriptional activator
LFLTHGAVSHQIKALEADLGTKLFRRTGRSMLLTEDGGRLYRSVHDALDRIAKGVAAVRADDRPQALTVSAPPSLATWLMPRLADFRRRHPNLEVNLSSSVALVDFNRDEVDPAVRFGSGVWSGVTARRLPLANVVYLVICSPTYRDGRLPVTLRGLRRCALIHYPHLSWAEFFKRTGMEVETPIRGLRFSEYPLAMQAATAGQGVMLANPIMVDAELADGRLVRVLPNQPFLPQPSAYYIVYPKDRKLPPKVRVFSDWLMKYAREPASE